MMMSVGACQYRERALGLLEMKLQQLGATVGAGS